MTTTTSNFRSISIPLFYNSEAECINSKKIVSKQSNPRYTNFTQNEFTVGDEEDFEKYRDATNGDFNYKNIDLERNIFNKISLHRKWNKNKNDRS